MWAAISCSVTGTGNLFLVGLWLTLVEFLDNSRCLCVCLCSASVFLSFSNREETVNIRDGWVFKVTWGGSPSYGQLTLQESTFWSSWMTGFNRWSWSKGGSSVDVQPLKTLHPIFLHLRKSGIEHGLCVEQFHSSGVVVSLLMSSSGEQQIIITSSKLLCDSCHRNTQILIEHTCKQ